MEGTNPALELDANKIIEADKKENLPDAEDDW